MRFVRIPKGNQPRSPRIEHSATQRQNRHDRYCRAPGTRAGSNSIYIQDLSDAGGSLSHLAQCGLCQSDAALHKGLLGEMSETFSIRARTTSFGENGIITCDFPLHGNFLIDLPDRRMEEKHRFQDLLRQIGPVIPTPEMREFVE